MSESKFEHHDLRLVEPSFGSQLTDLIIELEHLRKKQLGGTTHAQVFFQLKHIFHTLESIGSARIEGNNTTIAEYIETKIDLNTTTSPNIKEIKNIEETMSFIEEHIDYGPINRIFISEAHKMIVQGLAEYQRQGESETATLKAANDYARKNKLGIFSLLCTQVIPPDPKCSIKGNFDAQIAQR